MGLFCSWVSLWLTLLGHLVHGRVGLVLGRQRGLQMIVANKAGPAKGQTYRVHLLPGHHPPPEAAVSRQHCSLPACGPRRSRGTPARMQGSRGLHSEWQVVRNGTVRGWHGMAQRCTAWVEQGTTQLRIRPIVPCDACPASHASQLIQPHLAIIAFGCLTRHFTRRLLQYPAWHGTAR